MIALESKKVDRTEFETALTDLTGVLASKINTAELTTLLDAVPTHAQMVDYLRSKADLQALTDVKESLCTMCIDLEREVQDRASASALQQLSQQVQALSDSINLKLDSEIFYMSQGLMQERTGNVMARIQELKQAKNMT